LRPAQRANQRHFYILASFTLCRWISFLAFPVCFLLPGIAATQEGTPQEKPDTAVRAQMHNVKYRYTDKVAVQINSLDGALVPTGNNEFPVLDNKNSFKIRIDTAEIAISPTDLANLMNSYVFVGANSPLARISVAIVNGQLRIKGRLREKGDIPFETQGVMSPTPDGRVRLRSEKIKALHLPVKGLMEAFGIDVGDLIKSGKVPGVQAEDNDLILDLEQILPPPHIDGKVTAVRVTNNSIIQTFGGNGGSSNGGPPAANLQNANYMSYTGNRLRFGRLTMDDADVTLYDLDPADPMDFFLDHYKEQLAAGYIKITASFQLRVFLKDFNKLPRSKSKAKPM
jgi:hypothetical protein